MLVIALALAVAAPTPPPVLNSYIEQGAFSPGDYRWMRGRFDGASHEEQAQLAAVRSYVAACTAAASARVKAAFAALGVAAIDLPSRGYDDALCSAVSLSFPNGPQGGDWSAFTARLAKARPIGETLLWTVALAQDVVDRSPDAPADQLRVRIVADQTLRDALALGASERKGVPTMDEAERAIVRAMIWPAIARRDTLNTAWLKQYVARAGWPTIAEVGATASDDAWLLVQHADDDPVFQYRMLRLMEPLAARQEISARDFALLYDRVMLPITGKQRYGTQFVCRAGRWKSSPIEDPARVEALRTGVGMDRIEDSLKRITAETGPCR